MEPLLTGRPPDLEVRDVMGVEPGQVRVFRDPNAQLRLTLLDDRSYLHVKAMAAFPLTEPTRHIGLADGQNKQICLVEDLAHLDAESRRWVESLLESRYFSPRILKVAQATDEFGVVRWKVETDRGERGFYVRNLRDNLLDLPGGESLMTDVDGNRFILPLLTDLDKESRAKVLAVL